MQRLNRKVEYALMALKVMAPKRQGELTTAKEIAESCGCPFDATARVLQTLAQCGILHSEQGAYGGYQLRKDLSKLSFYELTEVILGPVSAAKCLYGNEICDLKSSCNIVSPMTLFNRKLAEFYQGLSVGELLRVRERSPERDEVRSQGLR